MVVVIVLTWQQHARQSDPYKAALLVDSRSHTFVEVDLERCSNNSGKREDGEHDEVLVIVLWIKFRFPSGMILFFCQCAFSTVTNNILGITNILYAQCERILLDKRKL